MNDRGEREAAVVAAGVAEVSLAMALDFETVKAKRHELSEVMIRFARAYVHSLGIADLGVDCEEYISR